jgi:hypothetical protein
MNAYKSARAAAAALAVLVAVSMLSTSGVAQAAKGCPKYKPKPPASESGNAEAATKAKAHKVTDKATEKKPLVVEYHQDPGAWTVDGSTPIVDTSSFHNFQLVTKKKNPVLTVRAEFMYPTASDLDFYLFDAFGNQAGASASFSPYPPANPDNGGEGFEQIPEIYARSCDGFTLESRPYLSPTGEDVTLKVWVD